MHYTYCHTTADTGKVFYIGKGTRKDRATRKDSRSAHWHNIVNKHGFNAEILAYWDTEEEAHSHEKLLIACFKDMGYKLANKTDGGEGVCGHKHSLESIEKNRLSAIKRMSNPETRAHLSRLNTGKKQSQETINKRRISNAGFKHTDASKKALSESSPYSKKVRCIETGEIFNSFTLAALAIGKPKNGGSGISTGVSTGQKRYGFHWELV
jgi:hypothetical protein